MHYEPKIIVNKKNHGENVKVKIMEKRNISLNKYLNLKYLFQLK